MPGMNRDAIEDLYSFTDFTWREIGRAIAAGGGDALLIRAAPGSGWPVLRDCLAHMLLAYERWLADKPGELPDYGDADFRTLGALEAYRQQVRGRFREYLTWSDADLY